MTLERNEVAVGVFGLEGTFPRPGWVVLDAARHHAFTGELTFETIPTVKVYLDGGLIYLAERVTDPSLGSRLVDAGALNAAQLEHGSMLLGDVAHLGRLFERVPSVNRQTVMVMTEMMTEECVGWLAGQMVRSVELAPYRHHPAGVQRWLHPSATHHLEPGDPLPAPPPDATPVELVAPEPLFSPDGSLDDGLITWDEPSWLDERLVAPPIVVSDEPLSSTGPVIAPAEPPQPPEPPKPMEPSEPKPHADAPSAPRRSFDAPDADLEARPAPDDDLPELPVRIPNASVADQEAADDWTEVIPDGADVPGGPGQPGEETSLSVESALDQLMAPTPASTSAAPSPDTVPGQPGEETSLSVESALDDARSPDDWVDRLDTDGLPEPGGALPPRAAQVPPSEPVPADRFEVIWPSGQVDEQLGSTDSAPSTERRHDPEGSGPTDRAPTSAETSVGDRMAAPPSFEPPAASPGTFAPAPDEAERDDDDVTDEVVLAVRRAVASIETSSLAARRRLVATEPDDDPSRGVDRPSERPIRSLRPVSETSDALTPGATSARRVPTRSVFDDDVVMVKTEQQGSAPAEPAEPAEPVLPVLPPPAPAPVAEQHEQRVGALRRLIGSLRRR